MAMSEMIPLNENLPDDFAEKWCNPTLEGMHAIVQWAAGRKG
jgi:hypothetical protein